MGLTAEPIEIQRESKKHLLRFSLALLISSILMLIYAGYHIGFMKNANYMILAGSSMALILTALVVMLVNRPGSSKGEKAGKSTAFLMMGMIWVICLLTPIFYATSGFILSLLGFCFIGLLAARIFSHRQTPFIMIFTFLIGVLAILLDRYVEITLNGLPTWSVMSSPWIVRGIVLLISGSIFLVFILKVRTCSLRTKFLFSFILLGSFSAIVVAWMTAVQAQNPVRIAGQQALLTFLVIAAVILIAFPLSNMLTGPVRRLAAVVNTSTSENLNARANVETEDEIGLLARAINQITNELQQTLFNMEQRVSERTNDLERRSLQLQAVAEIGRAVATTRNPDELLTMVARLISERFGFYHVGIFLLEEQVADNREDRGKSRINRFAVLRATNSEGGIRMMARGHRLLVGQQGIVGYVMGTGNPRIALDVGEDPQFFNNPDLPLTRSEMALALTAGNQVIGALDVQSTQAGAFTREDMAILQVMADLVAVAIENARLFTESQNALEASRRAYGELSRRAWIEMLASREELSYTSLDYPYLTQGNSQLHSVVQNKEGEISLEKPTEAEKTPSYPLSLPIKVRDTVIGYLDTYKTPESGGWTPEEYDMVTTIIDQLGVALESARLYEASQSQAERERLIGEVASRMRESLDVDAVLRTAVRELRRTLGISQVEVRIRRSQNEG